MRILFLAAGYGTRLHSVTKSTPKALLPLSNIPLLTRIVQKTVSLADVVSVDEVVVVSNNKFYEQFLSWKETVPLNTLAIVNDGSNSPDDRRGAVGDLLFGINSKVDDWLVIGADNFFDWELDAFVKFSFLRRPFPAVGLYNIKKKQSASRMGVVKIDREGIIREFEEKPEHPKSTLIAACIYFFPRESVPYIDEYVKQYENVDMIGNYISWLTTRTKVYGFLFQGDWIDIGVEESYKAAQKLIEKSYGAQWIKKKD